MNNQRSTTQQFFLFLALSWCAMMIFNQYFGPKKNGPSGPAQTAPALMQAFAGIDSTTPKTTTADASGIARTTDAAEVQKLDARLQKNGVDDYAAWARLRSGLIEQYVLQKPADAIKRYDEVINKNASDDIHAQSIYQKGDLQWNQFKAGVPKATMADAAKTLELLVHRGRGSSQYLDLKILVPSAVPSSPTALPASFVLKSVGALHGTWTSPDPQGLLERIDEFYTPTVYHQVFDEAVRILGNNPQWSYGLAILIFAICTRLLVQPINKRQYESMRGMQVIAPEMKKIQAKYEKRKDQQSQMQMITEIRALQKRHGVNPMQGCGLAVLQIPIFFFVVSPFIQHYEAKMDLVGASFLWINNLAHPDMYLLGIYAVSQFLSIRLSSTAPTDDQQRQMQIMMTFVFPLIAPIFLRTWPAAFTLYWMTFNVLSTIFQFRMMKAADPQKTFIKSLMTMPSIDEEAADAAKNASEAIPSRPQLAQNGAKPRAKDGSLLNTKDGLSTNSAALNGVSENGVSANGIFRNGGSANGATANGVSGKSAPSGKADGAWTNETPLNGGLDAGATDGSADRSSRSRRGSKGRARRRRR